MYDVDSPILDFYPKDFEQDLNGKKQEWEAVVKIPFIDENRLLQAMACTLPCVSRFYLAAEQLLSQGA
jgi:5'-3' exonuclease